MSKLQIDNICITSVNFALNDDFKNDEEIELSFSVTVNSFDSEEKKIVDVIVNTPETDPQGNIPFHFSVTGRGVFIFSEDVTENEDVQLKNINCPAIIFPYVREQVADLTRRSGLPPLHLPPVNFIKMHKEKNNNEEEE